METNRNDRRQSSNGKDFSSDSDSDPPMPLRTVPQQPSPLKLNGMPRPRQEHHQQYCPHPQPLVRQRVGYDDNNSTINNISEIEPTASFVKSLDASAVNLLNFSGGGGRRKDSEPSPSVVVFDDFDDEDDEGNDVEAAIAMVRALREQEESRVRIAAEAANQCAVSCVADSNTPNEDGHWLTGASSSRLPSPLPNEKAFSTDSSSSPPHPRASPSPPLTTQRRIALISAKEAEGAGKPSASSLSLSSSPLSAVKTYAGVSGRGGTVNSNHSTIGSSTHHLTPASADMLTGLPNNSLPRTTATPPPPSAVSPPLSDDRIVVPIGQPNSVMHIETPMQYRNASLYDFSVEYPNNPTASSMAAVAEGEEKEDGAEEQRCQTSRCDAALDAEGDGIGITVPAVHSLPPHSYPTEAVISSPIRKGAKPLLAMGGSSTNAMLSPPSAPSKTTTRPAVVYSLVNNAAASATGLPCCSPFPSRDIDNSTVRREEDAERRIVRTTIPTAVTLRMNNAPRVTDRHDEAATLCHANDAITCGDALSEDEEDGRAANYFEDCVVPAAKGSAVIASVPKTITSSSSPQHASRDNTSKSKDTARSLSASGLSNRGLPSSHASSSSLLCVAPRDLSWKTASPTFVNKKDFSPNSGSPSAAVVMATKRSHHHKPTVMNSRTQLVVMSTPAKALPQHKAQPHDDDEYFVAGGGSSRLAPSSRSPSTVQVCSSSISSSIRHHHDMSNHSSDHHSPPRCDSLKRSSSAVARDRFLSRESDRRTCVAGHDEVDRQHALHVDADSSSFLHHTTPPPPARKSASRSSSVVSVVAVRRPRPSSTHVAAAVRKRGEEKEERSPQRPHATSTRKPPPRMTSVETQTMSRDDAFVDPMASLTAQEAHIAQPCPSPPPPPPRSQTDSRVSAPHSATSLPATPPTALLFSSTSSTYVNGGAASRATSPPSNGGAFSKSSTTAAIGGKLALLLEPVATKDTQTRMSAVQSACDPTAGGDGQHSATSPVKSPLSSPPPHAAAKERLLQSFPPPTVAAETLPSHNSNTDIASDSVLSHILNDMTAAPRGHHHQHVSSHWKRSSASDSAAEASSAATAVPQNAAAALPPPSSLPFVDDATAALLARQLMGDGPVVINMLTNATTTTTTVTNPAATTATNAAPSLPRPPSPSCSSSAEGGPFSPAEPRASSPPMEGSPPPSLRARSPYLPALHRPSQSSCSSDTGNTAVGLLGVGGCGGRGSMGGGAMLTAERSGSGNALSGVMASEPALATFGRDAAMGDGMGFVVSGGVAFPAKTVNKDKEYTPEAMREVGQAPATIGEHDFNNLNSMDGGGSTANGDDAAGTNIYKLAGMAAAGGVCTQTREGGNEESHPQRVPSISSALPSSGSQHAYNIMMVNSMRPSSAAAATSTSSAASSTVGATAVTFAFAHMRAMDFPHPAACMAGASGPAGYSQCQPQHHHPSAPVRHPLNNANNNAALNHNHGIVVGGLAQPRSDFPLQEEEGASCSKAIDVEAGGRGGMRLEDQLMLAVGVVGAKNACDDGEGESEGGDDAVILEHTSSSLGTIMPDADLMRPIRAALGPTVGSIRFQARSQFAVPSSWRHDDVGGANVPADSQSPLTVVQGGGNARGANEAAKGDAIDQRTTGCTAEGAVNAMPSSPSPSSPSDPHHSNAHTNDLLFDSFRLKRIANVNNSASLSLGSDPLSPSNADLVAALHTVGMTSRNSTTAAAAVASTTVVGAGQGGVADGDAHDSSRSNGKVNAVAAHPHNDVTATPPTSFLASNHQPSAANNNKVCQQQTNGTASNTSGSNSQGGGGGGQKPLSPPPPSGNDNLQQSPPSIMQRTSAGVAAAEVSQTSTTLTRMSLNNVNMHANSVGGGSGGCSGGGGGPPVYRLFPPAGYPALGAAANNVKTRRSVGNGSGNDGNVNTAGSATFARATPSASSAGLAGSGEKKDTVP